MSGFVKRKPQPKLTKKLIQAHYNAQAPLDAPQPDYRRKKPRKFVSDDPNFDKEPENEK